MIPARAPVSRRASRPSHGDRCAGTRLDTHRFVRSRTVRARVRRPANLLGSAAVECLERVKKARATASWDILRKGTIYGYHGSVRLVPNTENGGNLGHENHHSTGTLVRRVFIARASRSCPGPVFRPQRGSV